MKHIFGPVPSRRLGMSLGVDIIPFKTCSLSCIYCQVGKTPSTSLTRREYIPAVVVLAELKELFESGVNPDWVTFSGSGEPTLNSGIGTIIRGIKKITDTPVCVITNGTLLWDPQVRRDIGEADAVMPSLDSAREETFQTLCRPHPDLRIEKIIDGLAQFRREYQGKIWLEIMFIEGANDSPEEIAALRDAVRRINPDSIQLNTVVRPPAESTAKPLSLERLKEIQEFFGKRAEIIAVFKGDANTASRAGIDEVREYLKRRSVDTDEISSALGIERGKVEGVARLHESGEIEAREFSGKRCWEYKGELQ